MAVLVAYATAHGSTKGVAGRISEQLRAEGISVDLRAADDVSDLSGYSAVVLGSAIHNSRWLTPAAALLTRINEKDAVPLWLFSVCTIGETTSFLGPRLSRIARQRRPLPADVAGAGGEHRFFAGQIEKSHWNFLGRAFFLLSGGSYGDHRDWDDIDQWARSISAVLGAKQPNV
ncbi:MAG: flavodoxin domain-containing protein [Microthrixaceae bacterium]